jgi:hypothetical protein
MPILLISSVSWGGVRLSLLVLRPLFGLLHQPRMVDDDECGTVGGILGNGNRSIRRKPAPVTLCPPQIAHDLTRARTRATAVGSRRLTARAMARPLLQQHSSQIHTQNRCRQMGC